MSGGGVLYHYSDSLPWPVPFVPHRLTSAAARGPVQTGRRDSRPAAGRVRLLSAVRRSPVWSPVLVSECSVLCSLLVLVYLVLSLCGIACWCSVAKSVGWQECCCGMMVIVGQFVTVPVSGSHQ